MMLKTSCSTPLLKSLASSSIDQPMIDIPLQSPDFSSPIRASQTLNLTCNSSRLIRSKAVKAGEALRRVRSDSDLQSAFRQNHKGRRAASLHEISEETWRVDVDAVERLHDERPTMSGLKSMPDYRMSEELYSGAGGVISQRGEVSPTDIVGGFGIGEGGNFSGGRGGGEGWDSNNNRDDYFVKMIEANPGNPLLLRNYALFLHEVQHDPRKAEEYYERAILASPGDGEVLSLYANLIWEVEKDAPRARTYFEQAVQAAPDDSYVVASYANFLWTSEEGEEEDGVNSLHYKHKNMPSADLVSYGCA